MASWLDRVAEKSFKAAPEGYVFQLPNTWSFAPPPRYLVNGAQKAVIGEIMRKRARLAGVCAVVGLLGAVTLGVVLLVFFRQYFDKFSINLLALAFAALMIIVPPYIYYMRRLRPIIRDLPTIDPPTTAMTKWVHYTGTIGGWLMVFGAMMNVWDFRWMSMALVMTAGGVLMAVYW